MRPIMRQALIALAAPLVLASCAMTRPAMPELAAPRSAAAPPACLAVKGYTQAQLEQMADAVRALPPGSPLRDLVVDYGRLRDEARAACARLEPPYRGNARM